jgi:hypothetical protein
MTMETETRTAPTLDIGTPVWVLARSTRKCAIGRIVRGPFILRDGSERLQYAVYLGTDWYDWDKLGSVLEGPMPTRASVINLDAMRLETIRE